MKDQVDDTQKNLVESFQSLFKEQELLAKVIEYFPYPIQVYSPDGTSVLVNQALIAEYGVSADAIVGKYNIFNDPYIVASGQLPVLRQAFQGETVFFSDIRVPLEDIAERYGIKDFDLEAVYQDITIFPILDDEKQVSYVAVILINRRIYRSKNEIERAKEYIENYWMEKFDLNKTARAACLSKAHFTKLFKKHTGITPHEYYTNYKLGKLKEKLLDTNLSISEAFAACNMDYNGHYARVFKEKTGLSPSAYRKMSAKNKKL
ncbi:MAG: helix-turn-helix domain-containing protein [Eubacteriales bacterium]|nr:helix-turn-helix domain-containing protein [Eubacteriales bacterium]